MIYYFLNEQKPVSFNNLSGYITTKEPPISNKVRSAYLNLRVAKIT